MTDSVGPSTTGDTTPLSAYRFMANIFAAMRLQGCHHLSMTDEAFYQAAQSAFDRLSKEAMGIGLKPTFNVRLDEIHQDSTTIRAALTESQRRRIISLKNPGHIDIDLTISEARAEKKLENLGEAGRSLFEELSREFLRQYGTAT